MLTIAALVLIVLAAGALGLLVPEARVTPLRAGAPRRPRGARARRRPGRRRRRQRVQRDPEVHRRRRALGGRARAGRGRLRPRLPGRQGHRRRHRRARRARPTSARASMRILGSPVAFGRTHAHLGPLPGRLGPPPGRRLRAVRRLHSRAGVRPQHDRDRGLAARGAARLRRPDRPRPRRASSVSSRSPARSGRRSSTAGTRRRSRPSGRPRPGSRRRSRSTRRSAVRVPSMRVSASEALPAGAGAEVQVGVRCAS